MTMAATVLNADPGTPEAIHNCPNCSHWLPEGTLACPDCHTLTYGRHLGEIAFGAQQLEQEGRWAEARARWQTALLWLPENTQQAASIQQHIAGIDQRFAAEEAQRARWTRRLGPFAPIVFFLLKIKTAIFFLFKLKFLLSLLVYFGVYWALFGWQFALGFVLSIFIHETGHYVAVRRRGMRAELPLFIPFMGGYVRWYSMGATVEQVAAISLAGPLFGLGSALVAFGLFFATKLGVFVVLANVIAWVNLINLIPVFGLEGSSATLALSRMQRGLVAATALLLFGLTLSISNGDVFSGDSPTQWVFACIGAGMLWRCFTSDEPEQPHTGSMTYFLAMLVSLAFLLMITHGQVAEIARAGGMRIRMH